MVAMPIIPSGLIHRAQVDREIAKAVRKLRKSDVVRVYHSIEADWSGEPAIYFRIVLTDPASVESNLMAVTSRITATLSDELRPYENWGLIPYFSFRSKSENAARNDPGWS